MPSASEEPLFLRVRTALDGLETAIERLARHDMARADADAEFAMMQDDRARLAVELDAALTSQRALAEANDAANERIAAATAAIERVLERGVA